MGRDSGRGRRTTLPAAATVAAVAALAVLAATSVIGGPIASTPAGAATKKSTSPSSTPKLAQTGHAAFWDCSAKSTELLVVVNTLTLHPGTNLNVSFTVRNNGTTPCNYTAPYASVAPGPTSTTLTAGPCGSVGFEIQNSHHHNVWPGAEVVNCPALGFAQLAAGATVSGTGSWTQTEPNSTRRVPPGRYTLTVENKHFSFPLRVESS
jgi:hypothetical protein